MRLLESVQVSKLNFYLTYLKDTVDYINVKSKTNHASTFLHVSRRAHCYIAGKASSELLDTLPK